MSHRARRTVAAALCALLLGLAAACTDDEGPVSESPTSPSPSATQPAVTTGLSFGKLTGRLPVAARPGLKAEVGTVVDGWLDAAYLDGDYPRRDFSDSSGPDSPREPTWRRDGIGALMSNADIGPRIDSVEAKKRTVRVDVLAARRKPAGVTAHVVLRFNTTGKVDGPDPGAGSPLPDAERRKLAGSSATTSRRGELR